MKGEQTKPIAIIGAGGHAKVLLDTLLLCGKKVVALVEKDTSEFNSLWGVPVIKEEVFFYRYNTCDIFLVNGIGSVKSLALRQGVYERFYKAGFEFTSVVHPNAIISPHCDIAADVQIMAGAIVQAGCKVGRNTIINTRASIDHDCQIGEHVHISPGTVISGEVHISEGTHLGTGSVLIQGVHIGKNALVAAGAVVVRSVPDYAWVKGVPAGIFL